MIYLEVAVAAPIDHVLTYAPPVNLSIKLVPGLRLLVPLGGRQVTGYLLGFTATAPAGYKIKPVSEVLDQAPLFLENFIPFCRWIAGYYRFPLGEVIKAALPGGLTRSSGRRVILTETGRQQLEADRKNLPDYPWLEKLMAGGMLPPAATGKIWQTKDRRILEKWADKKWLTITTELVGGTTGPRQETCVELAAPAYLDPELLKTDAALKLSEKKTLMLHAELAGRSGSKRVPSRDLTRAYPGSRKALKSLAQRGIIRLHEMPVYRDPFGELPPFFPTPETLTTEQAAALELILPTVRQRTYQTYLLHGVTGSGKTEVYLRAAEAALEMQRGVLVLVPEIALATYIEGHFLSRFGDRLAILHSGLTAGERFDQWQKIIQGQAAVVIGARSAIFAPLPDPGLIIVDEEHEGTFKQEDGLRYHARDLAVLRGSLAGATVILGSATPSLASYQHGQSGKYKLLHLGKRVARRPLPEVKVVDLRGIKTVSGRPPLFSNELVCALRENLQKKEQSLVFLNRRGYANLMLCRDCGQTIQCRHCNISLTLHKGRNLLVCHYCGLTRKSAAVCSNCRSTNLMGVGFGTERLEAELQALFPKAVIARLDRDTCTRRRDFLAVLKDMQQGRTDILLGTQMIAKGHHFPRVTLVGIVWADAGLGLPDFRAGERTFQLISQVSGRAGRGETPGRVIVQTHQPSHYSITRAKEHDFAGFFAQEMGLRQKFNFPPFARLINIKIEGDTEKEVQEKARQLARAAQKITGNGPVEILGPVPAPLSRLKGNYRWQLLFKSNQPDNLHALIDRLGKDGLFKTAGPKIIIDVDPENML